MTAVSPPTVRAAKTTSGAASTAGASRPDAKGEGQAAAARQGDSGLHHLHVEAVQVDVAQQWADNATLRGPDDRVFEYAVRQHASPKHLPQQLQYSAVRHSVRY